MSTDQTAPDIAVREVMANKLVTVRESDNAAQVAKLMDKNDVGSVIVIDRKGNPIGIITERDIVKRVAARNRTPNKVKAKDAMSKPLICVAAEMSITEAARKMRHDNIRRLAIMHAGRLAGIVTSRDILDVTPALIDVLTERSKMSVPPPREATPLVGYCDKCASWSDKLKVHDGAYVCEDCLVDIAEKGGPVPAE